MNLVLQDYLISSEKGYKSRLVTCRENGTKIEDKIIVSVVSHVNRNSYIRSSQAERWKTRLLFVVSIIFICNSVLEYIFLLIASDFRIHIVFPTVQRFD